MIRAVLVNRFGGPDVLRVRDLPTPTAGADELVVRVEVAGVNFRDVMVRRGAYPALPAPPLPIGVEGAGMVVEVGSSVTEFSVGDRVAWGNVDGSYAEMITIPARLAVPVPSAVSTTAAGALLSQGLTAHYLGVSVGAAIEQQQTALVLAAAGGVGRLLTQILASRGCRVIGAVSDDAKVPIARSAGAEDVVVGYDGIVSAAADFTGGRGVDALYDGVGGERFPSRLAAVRTRGLVVLYGASDGEPPLLDVRLLAGAGSLLLTRPRLADFIDNREDLLQRSGDVFEWLTNGTIDARITASFSLAEAADAHRHLESRATSGKLVINP
jgi:NADPH:quinone reductase